MSNWKIFPAIAAVGVTIFYTQACGEAPDPQLNDGCSYTYQNGKTELQWTAYKFTDKIGVSGGFDSFSVTGGGAADSVREAVAGLRFSIRPASVNSGVPDRDKKIVESFFGTMQLADEISGSVTAVNAGRGTIELQLNGRSRELPVEYSITDEVNLNVRAVVDIRDWQAGESLSALNKVCEEQHTGADEKSVLWPDVAIEIKTVLARDCGAAPVQ